MSASASAPCGLADARARIFADCRILSRLKFIPSARSSRLATFTKGITPWSAHVPVATDGICTTANRDMVLIVFNSVFHKQEN
jgi:hypothetical protein